LAPSYFHSMSHRLLNTLDRLALDITKYFDDTQLYIAVSNVGLELQLATLEKCIYSVHQWLLLSGLSLNPSMSYAIQFVTGLERSGAVYIATVSMSGVPIQPAETIKSLGIVLGCRCVNTLQCVQGMLLSYMGLASCAR
jgi:hypothetical protein